MNEMLPKLISTMNNMNANKWLTLYTIWSKWHWWCVLFSGGINCNVANGKSTTFTLVRLIVGGACVHFVYCIYCIGNQNRFWNVFINFCHPNNHLLILNPTRYLFYECQQQTQPRFPKKAKTDDIWPDIMINSSPVLFINTNSKLQGFNNPRYIIVFGNFIERSSDWRLVCDCHSSWYRFPVDLKQRGKVVITAHSKNDLLSVSLNFMELLGIKDTWKNNVPIWW